MHRLHRVLSVVAVASALCPTVARAQAILIADNFETDTSANYVVVSDDPTNGSATFAFDYVTAGIPLAPRSTPGDTNGLKLAVNTSLGAVNSQTVFNSTNVTAPQYRMLVDVFMAYEGSTATTIYAEPGVGGDGTTFNSVFTPISGSGSFMAFTGDGGSGSDYRWYLSSANGGATTLPNSDPSYLGHGSNGSGAFYQGLFPNPPSTAAGSPGNIWTTVTIDVDNLAGTITYSMTDAAGNSELIFDNSPDPLNPTPFTGLLQGLVSLGATDTFTSTSPASVFVVYDNLEVSAVPEPGAAVLMGLGGLVPLTAGWRRGRNRRPN